MDSETCEFGGKGIEEGAVHNWMLEAYPLPIRFEPRYRDSVLALCEWCFKEKERQYKARLTEQQIEELRQEYLRDTGLLPRL